MKNSLPICNHNPESAPIINGKPFIICWRCSGAAFGIILTFLSVLIYKRFLFKSTFPLNKYELFIVFLLCLPSIIDFVLNKKRVKNPNNILRFTTGILLGTAEVLFVDYLLIIVERLI